MATLASSSSARRAIFRTRRDAAVEYRPFARWLRPFRRKGPSTYHKCLAVHMLQAEQLSALR